MPERDPERPPAATPAPAPDQAPAIRSEDPEDARAEVVPAPDIRGTIVFTMLLLMGIFGIWAMMYLDLLGR